MIFADPADCETRVEKAVSGMFDVDRLAPGMFGVYSYSSDSEYTVDVLEGRCTCEDRAPRCKHYFRVVLMRPAMLEAITADVDASALSREPDGGPSGVETDGGQVVTGELPGRTATAASRMSDVEEPDGQELEGDDGLRDPEDPDPDCPDCMAEFACVDCAVIGRGE